MNDLTKTSSVQETKELVEASKKSLKLRPARKLKSGEALKDLVSKKRVLPACESSSACSRKDT